MTADQHEIILHHYDASPFSEKVRLVLGMKGLSWRSVQIPIIMPKPDLMPLTGGYRRTPVMQIGADIYCDTQMIIRKLDDLYPEPTIFSAGRRGMPFGLGMWADRAFFQATTSILFANFDALPEPFVKDREAMFGQAIDLKQLKAIEPAMRDEWRAFAGWVDDHLNDGKPYVMGNGPGLADANAYMNIWFVQKLNPQAAEDLLKEFGFVRAWAERLKTIGHGNRTELDAQDALEIAKTSEPATQIQEDPLDPIGRKPGDKVSLCPNDYGKDPVIGEIVSSSAQHISIRRHDDVVGNIVVHFPRAGFAVTPA